MLKTFLHQYIDFVKKNDTFLYKQTKAKEKIMKKSFIGYAMLVLPFALVACGDDSSSTSASDKTKSIDTFEKIEDCTEKLEGESVYVEDEDKTYVCEDEKWVLDEGDDVDNGGNDNGGESGNNKNNSSSSAQNGNEGESSSSAQNENKDNSSSSAQNGNKDNSSSSDGGKTNSSSSQNSEPDNKCGTKTYNPETEICKDDKVLGKCGDDTYDLESEACEEGKVLGKCGDESYDATFQECNSSNEIVLKEDVIEVTTEWLNQTMLANGDYGFLYDSRDHQLYRTVKIGTQTWMAQNLNIHTENSVCHTEVAYMCTNYGSLYTYEEALTVCPEGWHLSTLDEYNSDLTVSGEDASTTATKLKSTSTDMWPAGAGTDDYGFAAIPATGMYMGEWEMFDPFYQFARFWMNSGETPTIMTITSHKLDGSNVSFESKDLYRAENIKYPVRCVKDYTIDK